VRLDSGRILVAPDSFKGTLSAAEASVAMGRGVRRALPRASVRLHPVSDGGEGFIDALIPFMGGAPHRTEVRGPLPGQKVRARWALVGKGTTAVIEMASAAGLALVPHGKRDPRVTTTFGVGELILSALKRNVGSILVGIGGSATNDGGAGMATALGVKFLDSSGAVLPPGGASLADLARIDISGLDPRLPDTAVTVASVTGLAAGSRPSEFWYSTLLIFPIVIATRAFYGAESAPRRRSLTIIFRQASARQPIKRLGHPFVMFSIGLRSPDNLHDRICKTLRPASRIKQRNPDHRCQRAEHR